MRRSRGSIRNRLGLGLVLAAACSTTPPPPGGLLSSPEGAALANGLLFVANQDGNELHVFDTQAAAITQQPSFRPAPNWMFPLSIPTVRRPGPVCGNGLQMFTASSVDPVGAFIDANDNNYDDGGIYLDGGFVSPANPPTGLRELGQLALPGVASSAVCAPEPGAVLARKMSYGGPAQYLAAMEVQEDAGIVDFIRLLADGGATVGILPDGGLDERDALAALPLAAILTFNANGSPTQIWEATNDITGASCGDSPETAPHFCPSLKPLLTLPNQPPQCNPQGPPLAQRADLSGANIGNMNFDRPNVEPLTANILFASDANSNCVAEVDLDTMEVQWIPVGFANNGVFSLAYFPPATAEPLQLSTTQTPTLPGASIFAVVRDSELCEEQGAPPVGGYFNCNEVSFLQQDAGFFSPIMEPLVYPFVPRHAEPPLRMNAPVTQVTFVGPPLEVFDFSTELTTTIPIALLGVIGDTAGSLTYVDMGYGSSDGGTGPLGDGGTFAPPAYLAPRIFDTNDYIPSPVAAQILNIVALDADGGSSVGVVQAMGTIDAGTADGGQLPYDAGASVFVDRFGNGITTGFDANAEALSAISCVTTPTGAELCVTLGMLQKGVANDEIFTVTYQGVIGNLGALSALIYDVNEADGGPAFDGGGSLYLVQIPYAPWQGAYPTLYDGLLVTESQNLLVELTGPDGNVCGDYQIADLPDGGVTSEGLYVVPIPNGDAGVVADCPTSNGGQQAVTLAVYASGNKPYIVSGSLTGFVTQLWPDDGTFHLVPGTRWHYPNDLIGMERSAQQLVDIVYGPPSDAGSPAPNGLAYPTPTDYAALDDEFGLAVAGPLGPATDGGIGVLPERGAYWSFDVSSGVVPLTITPLDSSSDIQTLTAYTDPVDGGTPHVIGTYRGGNALIELDPDIATWAELFEVH